MGVADLGTGLVISYFPTGGADAEPIWAGMTRDVNETGIEREAIDASHNKSAKYREFISGDLSDPGECSVDILFDPDDVVNDDPMDLVSGVLTITFSKLLSTATTQRSVTQSAFVLNWEWAAPFEDLMTGVVTFKLGGAPTWIAESGP